MDHDVYKVRLKDIVWLQRPRALTKEIRAALDAFKERPLDANAGFLVQTTRGLSPHDFQVLTAAEVA